MSGPVFCSRRKLIVLACCFSAAVAVGCGGVSPEQKQALQRVQELGGRVNVKRGGYEVDLTKSPVEDKDLVVLKDISNIKTLNLSGTRVTDAGLAHLTVLTSLEFLDLRTTTTTPQGAEGLKKALPNVDIRR